MSDVTDLKRERLWSRTDPGAQRQREQPKPEAASDEYITEPQQAHHNGYVPYFLRDRAQSVQVVPVSLPSRFPAYSSLLDIMYDHDHQSAFTLVYSFMLVKVTGKNLGLIVHALNFRRCSAIYQFWPKRFSGPPDADKPLIEGIEIVAAIDKTVGFASTGR